MADFSLTIDAPAHGSALTAPPTLRGSATGNTAGLFYKWYSTLKAATADHPELNSADHSAAALTFPVPGPLAFGSHALLLTASDRDGDGLASIQAVTRSAMAGGAPPVAPAPCVVHQLTGAQFRPPVVANEVLSKAGASIQFLAPGAWMKLVPDPASPLQAPPFIWVKDEEHQALNGITIALRLEPDGLADEAHSATITLDPVALRALPFAQDADKAVWLQRSGPLPANLGVGAYRLKLVASAAGQSVAVSRLVTLIA